MFYLEQFFVGLLSIISGLDKYNCFTDLCKSQDTLNKVWSYVFKQSKDDSQIKSWFVGLAYVSRQRQHWFQAAWIIYQNWHE